MRVPKWSFKAATVTYTCKCCKFETSVTVTDTVCPALGVCRCGGLMQITFVAYLTVGEDPMPSATMNHGFDETDLDAIEAKQLGISMSEKGDDDGTPGNEDDDLQWN
jgi:hypothetical protein